MSETPPPVRVGDSARRVVDDQLMAAVSDGVLTLAEYDERAALLWQARTRGELDELVADLPASAPAQQAVALRPPRSPRRVVAVMSEDRLAGPVQPGQDVTGWAVMGRSVLDLRRDDLPDGTRVRVRAVMARSRCRCHRAPRCTCPAWR